MPTILPKIAHVIASAVVRHSELDSDGHDMVLKTIGECVYFRVTSWIVPLIKYSVKCVDSQLFNLL